MRTVKPLVAALSAISLLVGAAYGQGIERKAEPFSPQLVLPLAAPQERPAAPSAAPEPAAVSAPAPLQAWRIEPTDLRLDRVLRRWAEAAGWRIQWDAARHVELAGPNTFRGSFEQAVAQVLSTPGIRLSEYPLEGCIYPNTPPLLRITRQGEQAIECPSEFKQ